jgi:hypothetical protein
MRLEPRYLRPHSVDARARIHAHRIAEQWRDAGLMVDEVEYLRTSSDPGGYTLTVHSEASTMSCRCESWRVRRSLWHAHPLWTITVSVRDLAGMADGGVPPPARPVGVAAAWEHERAWDRVGEWIDGSGSLPATLEDALAELA